MFYMYKLKTAKGQQSITKTHEHSKSTMAANTVPYYVVTALVLDTEVAALLF